MSDLLTTLYAGAGFVAVISYLPQIVTLIQDKTGSHSVNLLTFFVWSGTNLIIFIYAYIVNGDSWYVFLSFVNLAGCVAMFVIAAYNRHFKAVR